MRKFITLCALLPLINGAYAADKYTLDPNHTFVEWTADHFGFSHPTGKWLANGTLEYDAAALQNSKVKVDIKMAEIATGIPELDKHLKGKLFFDVDKYPTATFESTMVEVANNQITKVMGTLNLRGVAKPVTLDAKLNKVGKNPITDKDTIGFSGHATLKRSDFGITTLIPGVGDEVKLNIEVEGSKN